MDFYADIIRIAKAELDLYEVGYADLSDARRIVERWINVYLKLIKPRPRDVVWSKNSCGVACVVELFRNKR
jgi:hypothetical protein